MGSSPTAMPGGRTVLLAARHGDVTRERWTMSSEPTECGFFRIVRITDKAILVSDDGDETWIPKSEVCDESEINGHSDIDDEGPLVLPEWLAIEKGLV